MTTDTASEANVTTPTEPVHVSDQGELSTVVEDHDVVLTDFYADWCGPCKMLEPVVERLAAETDAAIAKVDVDKSQELAAAYNVQGVPTLVLFADGDVVEEVVGAQPEEQLRALIEEYSE